jgi:CRISPR-associated endonuclease/helicase Cas3
LLPFHLLDVAAVGREFIARDSLLRTRLCRLLGFQPAELTILVTFFFALHDLGKFGDVFQGQQPEFYQLLLRRSRPRPALIRHSDLGYLLWKEGLFKHIYKGLPEALQREFPGEWDLEDILDPLARTVLGHHGRPPQNNTYSLNDSTLPDDIEAARGWLDALLHLVPFYSILTSLKAADERGLATASWLLAGLMVLCDWLGSNVGFFPPQDRPLDLQEYLENIASQQAQTAIIQAGVIAPPAGPALTLDTIKPDAQAPTPLQALAQDWTATDEPQLVIVEDATGSGKTEAALMFAHRLMGQGAGEGLFFALPTMATSNAMYDRLAKSYSRLFLAGSRPSLVLTHSAGRLHQGFLDSQARDTAGIQAWDEEGAAYCSQWLADNRKKALLAAIGVGTIDQALMGVLPFWHQCLRLLGLGRNVLVVDEVHAYDPYMLRLLCNLLRFQAAFGSSAVLLSASLPLDMRRKLVNAFYEGLDESPPKLQEEHYPMLTTVQGGKFQEKEVQPWEKSRRRVKVKFVHSPEQVRGLLRKAARKGQCACWIRNTVADAVEAWEDLKPEFPAQDLLLFHARFAMCDRLAIEKRVLTLFGKESTQKQRAGKVLIATQVVEQSLDLDFDLVISDLAPIDLLIQRMGRLQRHEREYRKPGPVLVIHAPPLEEDPGPDWYKDHFPRASYVYPDHGRLWLAAHKLHQAKEIVVTGGIRALIEAVYGEVAKAQIPEGLEESSTQAEGRAKADYSLAQFNHLNLELGYADHGDEWLPDIDTPTRLGERTTTLRLARWDGVTLTPWCEHPEPDIAWALSQVNLAYRLVAGPAQHAQPLAAAVENGLKNMRDKGRWSVLVPMEQQKDSLWVGEALNPKNQVVKVNCHRDYGVKIDL